MCSAPSSSEPQSAILWRDRREDAPRFGELGVQKNAALEANDAQQI